LYAPTEILSHRLELVLQENHVPFALHRQTFAVNEASSGLVDLLRAQLSPPETDDLRVSSDLAHLMAATSLRQMAHRADTAWFERALREDRFTHWFQPIVDAGTEEVLGHECLVRLPKDSGGFYNGQEILDAALGRGDMHVFDSYSRRTAIRSAARQHTRGRVFINFMPSSIYNPAFCMASTLLAMQGTHLEPRDIVFEVVESERVGDPRHLRRIAEYYREEGFGIALDDVGTGSNSLQMISEIEPDFIKLDKSIVWRCDTAIGLKTIQKLAELGADTGIGVIAEGVESEPMRDTLLTCGIHYMQGYFFGRPAPEMRVRIESN
jgi:EAL domain-containing protein (putative c-di-GMP-specific phosphodiesterase class I)